MFTVVLFFENLFQVIIPPFSSSVFYPFFAVPLKLFSRFFLLKLVVFLRCMVFSFPLTLVSIFHGRVMPPWYCVFPSDLFGLFSFFCLQCMPSSLITDSKGFPPPCSRRLPVSCFVSIVVQRTNRSCLLWVFSSFGTRSFVALSPVHVTSRRFRVPFMSACGSPLYHRLRSGRMNFASVASSFFLLPWRFA